MTEAEKFFNFGLQYYNGDGVDEDFKKLMNTLNKLIIMVMN